MKLTRSNSTVSDKPTSDRIASRSGIATACMLAMLSLAACGGGGGSSDPAQAEGGAAGSNGTAGAAVQIAGVDATASSATPVPDASNASDPAAPARANATASAQGSAATPAQPATKPSPTAPTPAPVAPAPVAGAPANATVTPAPSVPAAAAATPNPAASSAPQTEAVLAMINARRSATHKCGETFYAPARPLLANLAAEQAASQHSAWMQQNTSLSHAGANNSDPGSRLEAAGYKWSAVAENVAAGYETAQQVIDAWMESAPHCANIMRGDFNAVGFSMVQKSASTVAYATLVLAKSK